MIRTKLLGLGGYVPDRVVDNDELAHLNERHERQPTRTIDTDDAWIRQRTGIETRRFVPNDGSVATSDLAAHAARRALADAQVFDMSNSESPEFQGLAVAHLFADPERLAKSGKAMTSADLALEYGFCDIDGRQPIPLTLETS